VNATHFARQIKKVIFERTGLTITVHLFRHIVVKLFLGKHPEGFETMRQHLRHRRMATLTTNYADLQNSAASRHVDRLILTLRNELCGEGDNDA
jgi:hypothetical protein